MSLLSNVDIQNLLDKEIVIHPFEPRSLSPVGYDFSVGDFVNSLENGILTPNEDGCYELPSNNTIQILTKESLWVSRKIGGTFNSKVSLVSKGLSHISTSLDPGWYGPLLFTMRNNTDATITIDPKKETFVTLLLFRVLSKTDKKHNKPPSRIDILATQLDFDSMTKKYFEKISEVITKQSVFDEFAEKVEKANEHMPALIKNTKKKFIKEIIIQNSILILVLFLISIGFYWKGLSEALFQGIAYDSKIIAAQLTGITTLSAMYFNRRRYF